MKQDDNYAERNVLLDTAKGIGIVLVVYGHVARGTLSSTPSAAGGILELADSVIYSFHMPLFFFISGIVFLSTLNKNGFALMMAGKIDSIVYPYITWSIIQGILEVAFSSSTNNHTNLISIVTLLWKPRAQFWFLYTLFFVFALSGKIFRHQSKKYLLLSLALSTVFSIVFYGKTDIFLANTLFRFFPYFVLGIICGQYPRQTYHLNTRSLFISITFFCILNAVILPPNISKEHLVNNTLSLATAVSGIALTLSISSRICKHSTHLAYLGKNSLCIYLAHIIFGSGTRIVLSKILHISSTSTSILLATITGIYGPILLLKLSERYNFSYLFKIPNCLSIYRKTRTMQQN